MDFLYLEPLSTLEILRDLRDMQARAASAKRRVEAKAASNAIGNHA
jgi:hypothetical protein